MKRRTFVIVTTLGLGIASIPIMRSIRGSKYDHLIESLPIATIFSQEDIYRLGSAYRDQYPDEDNLEELKARLGEGQNPSHSTEDHLSEMIRNDFETGKTVIIEGWMLSITEARQCALYSKVKSNRL